MPDIIERLQANESAYILTNEAAAEIYRLRSILLDLQYERASLVEILNFKEAAIRVAQKTRPS